jgi:hypothetical protein
VYDSDPSIVSYCGDIALVKTLYPIAHRCHYVGDDREGWRVMVWPREMVNSSVNLFVGIASTFGAKLEDSPVFSMFAI